jgi:DUF1009 family protein
VPTLSVDIAKTGAIVDFLHEQNVDRVIFAGSVKRPNFGSLLPDKKGASWLMRLGKFAFSGDDALLCAVAQLAAEEGFEIISGTELTDEFFVPPGTFSRRRPTAAELSDIEKGLEAARTLGKADIGQSIIVCDGEILGTECAEGTDELIGRCAKLRKTDSGGILVKACKPQQDRRFDLPTVGADTVEKLHAGRFSGIAIESGQCIVIDKNVFLKLIDEAGMFFVCV